jgi:general secretion pathway protein L
LAEFLVIRLPADASAPAEWIAVDGNGARRGEPAAGALADAAAAAQERRVIVLVPGTDVLTAAVDIPVKGGARLQAALPYALEEHLAEDVETLHFAAGPRRASGKVPVAVVRRDTLVDWLARLADAGVTPWSVVPENYGLARLPGTISLLVSRDEVMINDGADVEVVMQGVRPGDALAAIGALDDGDAAEDARDDDAAAPAPAAPVLPRHALVYCDAETDERYRHDWIALRQELETLDVRLLPDGVTPRLAATVATGAGVNLLQGEFATRTEYAPLLRRWRVAAMLLGAFVLTGLLARATDLYFLSREEAALRDAFLAEYQQVAPGASAVRDPAAIVASLRTRTGHAEAPARFLQSLEDLSLALRAQAETRIESLSYRGGIVDVRLNAPNVTALDGIQKAIQERGRFKASIQGTSQQGERVSSQIRMEASGP